jgi:CDP-glucose 4,6-dehydratase
MVQLRGRYGMTDSFRDRRVLVTGATGIVGSWLVKELLARGARVVALVRDELPDSELVRSGDLARIACVRGSLENLDLIVRTIYDYEVEVLFHLGAQTQVRMAHRNPFECLESNVRGTYNVLEAVRRAQSQLVAVVIASSDKAYGTSTALPYTEKHPLAGTGIYDVSKSAADLISSAYARTYGLPISIARCGNIYGGGDLNWERIVPGTIRSLLLGERPTIRSDGRPLRDYVFVEDAVDAYLSLADAVEQGVGRGDGFNFGHGSPVSVIEIVDMLRRILGREDLEPHILGQATNEIPAQYLDPTKARDTLGWRPGFDLEAGLRKTVMWYEELLG